MTRRDSWTEVSLKLDNGEEVSVRVKYEIHPAEPDVGIMREYVEMIDWECPARIFLSEGDLDRIQKIIELEIGQ